MGLNNMSSEDDTNKKKKERLDRVWCEIQLTLNLISIFRPTVVTEFQILFYYSTFFLNK